MLIESSQIIAMKEANQNFSKVTKLAEETGCVVIFKNNKPKYVLLDIDVMKLDNLKSEDRIDKLAKKKLNKAAWL